MSERCRFPAESEAYAFLSYDVCVDSGTCLWCSLRAKVSLDSKFKFCVYFEFATTAMSQLRNKLRNLHVNETCIIWKLRLAKVQTLSNSVAVEEHEISGWQKRANAPEGNSFFLDGRNASWKNTLDT